MFDLEPWTVFRVGMTTISKVATVDATGEDDAIITATEQSGEGGRCFALPAAQAQGREVVVVKHNSARFA